MKGKLNESSKIPNHKHTHIYIVNDASTPRNNFFSCHKNFQTIKLIIRRHKIAFYARNKIVFIRAKKSIFVGGIKIFITLIKCFCFWHNCILNFSNSYFIQNTSKFSQKLIFFHALMFLVNSAYIQFRSVVDSLYSNHDSAYKTANK